MAQRASVVGLIVLMGACAAPPATRRASPPANRSKPTEHRSPPRKHHLFEWFVEEKGSPPRFLGGLAHWPGSGRSRAVRLRVENVRGQLRFAVLFEPRDGWRDVRAVQTPDGAPIQPSARLAPDLWRHAVQNGLELRVDDGGVVWPVKVTAGFLTEFEVRIAMELDRRSRSP